ncbi:glycosyltransferase [Flavobacterium jejuense]|uniref:Glycosyltransferase n=1 Tax=Flavobacterium jejuense TaxID=1544455 RepID=A0ABX0IX90_9FLAO|nr:glycosyltransferase [Flavobacterium jejuense]NHN27439.1 glycosyltransferase [Flavobacterium jejuense]
MNFDTKHIVILTPGFAASEEDSTTIPAMQVYLKTLIKATPKLNITIISFQFPFTTQTYNWNGITVIPLNGKNSKIKKLFIWHKANRVLKKLNLENPISVLHSFWIGECSFLGDKFAENNKLKHIVTAMGQDVCKKNRYVFHLRKSKSKIITLSQNHHDILLVNHHLESEIIPWFIDKNDFPNLKENKIDILGVGSLSKIKNYPLFIQIIREVVKEKPELKVEIIGEGKAYFKIKRMIKTHNLQNTITLTGKLSRIKVLEKMSESKILVHTSTYESFGFIFAEALYAGMHIISFDVGARKSIEEWYICSTLEMFKITCLNIINKIENKKTRIVLNCPENTINLYSNLYDSNF